MVDFTLALLAALRVFLFPFAAHDDQVDALTQALNRLYRLSSSIYTTPESDIVVDPCEIPPHWPRAFGMDIRWHGTAALWGALDPQRSHCHR